VTGYAVVSPCITECAEKESAVTLHRPAIDVIQIAPIRHGEAMQLAYTEYERLSALLSSLDVADWQTQTCCSPWTVRDMATHLLGYMRACSSPREMIRQLRTARRRDGSFIDAMSALQVSEMAGLSPAEITAEVRALIDPAVTGRDRVPAWLRRLAKVPAELPVSGGHERWPLGFVVDTIGTRDVWTHRTDISQAIGRDPELTPHHDGRIVADVVAEWSRRHGRAVDLLLDGPAGGAYSSSLRIGSSDVELYFDAVEFCRLLSGRDGSPPLGAEVPF
jgi:uncharacterized protein (TIGR03083 family)